MRLDNIIKDGNLSLAKERSELSIDINSIGRLSEKTVHRTLKFLFEPNEIFHEVAYLGSVADIKNSDGIIEIQTRSFDKLIPKLDRFLTETEVVVVHPIIQNKCILKVDSETGEVVSRRKSNKHGRLSNAILEIAKLKTIFPNENLRILLLFLDADETRSFSKKRMVGKRSTEKIDLIPTAVNGYFEVREVSDLYLLLPDNLPLFFSALDFEKCTGYRKINRHIVLKFLLEKGILTRKKEKGNAFIYNVNK